MPSPLNDTSLASEARCDPSELPSQPAVLGTYWRPQVEVVTTGQVTEGYQVKSMIASPSHVLMHRVGQVPMQDLPQVVETEAIDLTGLNETREFTVQLKLPEKGEMIGTPKANVTIEIGLVNP